MGRQASVQAAANVLQREDRSSTDETQPGRQEWLSTSEPAEVETGEKGHSNNHNFNHSFNVSPLAATHWTCVARTEGMKCLLELAFHHLARMAALRENTEKDSALPTAACPARGTQGTGSLCQLSGRDAPSPPCKQTDLSRTTVCKCI